jgi:glycosyltransferase involved in cell wall biosynthesis
VKISVVIPSYNSGSFIREAIESALSQSYAPYEVIVQDGGSSDTTVNSLRSYGDRVIWVSERDLGQSDALNRAITKARGDVISWLNADDRYVPGAFGAAAAALEAFPDAGLVYGDFDVIDASGKCLRTYSSPKYRWERLLLRGCYIFSGSMFFRRSLIDRVGSFDPKLHACMDYDYLLRVGDAARPVHTGRKHAQFRVHAASKTTSGRTRFLREAHNVRWRHAGSSARLRSLALVADAETALALLTAPVRQSRLWFAVRGTHKAL